MISARASPASAKGCCFAAITGWETSRSNRMPHSGTFSLNKRTDRKSSCIAGEREGLLLCGDHGLGDVMIEQNAALRDILVEEAHVGESRCKELLVKRCNRKLAHLQGGPAASVECQLARDLQMPVAASVHQHWRASQGQEDRK